ncbi:MAG TPA: bifunctional oligoribonuclease/PAP phosphatase NrnA [Micromonosporaceae bacterium]
MRPTDEDWAAAVDAVRALPTSADIVLACHVNPDGDALGSMLGFALGLRRLGYRPQATFPEPFVVPEPLRALPGVDLLVPPDRAVPAPRLMACFDAASQQRLVELSERFDRADVSLVVDHHASNHGFGTLRLVDPAAAATSVVVVELLDRLGVPLDRQIAECLYVALATDTGSFKFDMTTPEVHRLAARLLDTGLRPGEISRRLFDARPFAAVRLYGEVLSRTVFEPAAAAGRGLVWSYATLDDLARHGLPRSVMEGLIDEVRCAEEADVACVAKQVGAQEWAMSLRSKGAVDVAALAMALGGGGHRVAAGFTGYGSLETVIGEVRSRLG